MEASSEGGHVTKGAVVPYMEWNILQLMNTKLGIF
jgi:predicted DNA-binding protein with PD1-like motif